MCRLPAIASFCLSELRLRVNGFIDKWWQSRMVLAAALYYMLVGKGWFKHLSHIYTIFFIDLLSQPMFFLIWVPAGLPKRTSQDKLVVTGARQIQEGSGGAWQLSSRLFKVRSGSMKSGCISNRIVTFQISLHFFQWTMIMGERVLHSNLILFVDLSCSVDCTQIRPSVAVSRSVFLLNRCRIEVIRRQYHWVSTFSLPWAGLWTSILISRGLGGLGRRLPP